LVIVFPVGCFVARFGHWSNYLNELS
jgi:hypothetical protein